MLTINHPFPGCLACDWSFGDNDGGLDAVEVWNSKWDKTDEQAVRWWDAELRKGARLTAIAGSDTHDSRPGEPSTVVWARNRSQGEILQGIRRGHVYLIDKPDAGQFHFSARAGSAAPHIPGDELVVSAGARVEVTIQCSFGNEGSAGTATLISAAGIADTIRLGPNGRIDWGKKVTCEKNSYFRVDVRDAQGNMLALSNPIFLKVQ